MKNKYLDWIIYQIYPRSFCDLNGDGIGDLRGITSKLDYLKELGVNAVWLSPCYKSPNCDNGYDISDYYDIGQDFGTLDDWKEMISEMDRRGIKLIMDFVANHTSSEHEWFKQAKSSRDNPYHDFYYWTEKPNDWQSVFGGPAWEYNPPTGEYYLHTFAVGQPDLNWENPRVREEMCKVVDFWADLGVAGFRCDVLDCISKDFKNNKMSNGPRLHEYIKLLFGREKARKLFTVGECGVGEDAICDLCGSERDELSCVFQFEHFDVGRGQKMEKKPFKLDEIRDILVKWQYFAERKNIPYTLFTDNHDNAHYLSRLGNDGELRYECATMFAAMFYLLKGIPFIYQGQEYGAADPRYDDIGCFDDIETFNYYNEFKDSLSRDELLARINFGSRDNVRRPMCWNGGKNFGFSTAERTWIPLHTRGAEINAERDAKSEKSVSAFYKKVFGLRKTSEAARSGEFRDVTAGDGYFAYTRTCGGESLLVVCNFGETREISGLPKFGRYLFGNYAARSAPDGVYKPYETAIFFEKN